MNGYSKVMSFISWSTNTYNHRKYSFIQFTNFLTVHLVNRVYLLPTLNTVHFLISFSISLISKIKMTINKERCDQSYFQEQEITKTIYLKVYFICRL